MKKSSNKNRSFLKMALWIGLGCAAAILVTKFVIQRAVVNGDSMAPAYQNGDVVWVDKLHYYFFEPERFDIVVFPYQYREEKYYTKRIIGLPGETVQIIDGKIYIDENQLEETYGMDPIEKPRRAEEPVLLGQSEYFVLGDNRNHSSDSRDLDIGNITKEEMIGRVIQWRGK